MQLRRLTPTALVVPCFNEADRLDTDAFLDLAERLEATLVFVDDGSTDATPAILSRVHARQPRVHVLTLASNVGKGEAVRAGLLAALASGAGLVGYFDADLATAPAEIARLVDIAESRTEHDAIIASRVGLLGHHIERSAVRHYLGRIFATASSIVLGLRVYDTQCGAKLFRATDPLRRALSEPFVSTWAFDVELLGRLTKSGLTADRMLEVPLVAWRDVGSSKLSVSSALRAALDLIRIRRTLR